MLGPPTIRATTLQKCGVIFFSVFLCQRYRENRRELGVQKLTRISLKQGGPGTEPEPETGTVGTVFAGTERGTGTAGTVFQEPEPSSL